MSDIRIPDFIYLIDDEPDYLALTKTLLSEHGYQVKTFSRGEDLLEHIGTDRPFVIFADYRNPEANGLELHHRIHQQTRDIPYVLLTGQADKALLLQALKSGINDVLEKPCKEDELLFVVQRFENLRREILAEENAEKGQVFRTFLEESTEILDDLESHILRLGDGGLDPLVIDALFRKIHTIKGSSSPFPEAQALGSLAHHFEDKLAELKKGKIKLRPELLNIFLSSADSLSFLLKLLKEGKKPDLEQSEQIASLEEALQSAVLEEAHPSVADNSFTKMSFSQGLNRNDDSNGIWVGNDKLDTFLALTGDFVILKNRFDLIARNPQDKHLVVDFSHSLTKITDALQQGIMSLRKISLDRAAAKIPRLVHQTSQQLRREVNLVMEGFEIGIDKTLAKGLSASLTHLVRNALDHGLETPEDRMQKGKNVQGLVRLKAWEARGSIHLSVSDDGQGLNTERVKKKAIEQKLVSAEDAAKLSPAQIHAFIFQAGLSTSDTVTEISGRGVGLDFVKQTLEDLGGSIDIDSQPGIGTTFTLAVPIPQAVMVENSLLVRWQEHLFAIPLSAVARIVHPSELKKAEFQNRVSVQFEGTTVPLRSFGQLMNRQSILEDVREGQSVVFLKVKDKTLGLIVDEIKDQFEAVVQPFDAMTGELLGFKGTTLVGERDLSFVLDAEALMELRAA